MCAHNGQSSIVYTGSRNDHTKQCSIDGNLNYRKVRVLDLR